MDALDGTAPPGGAARRAQVPAGDAHEVDDLPDLDSVKQAHVLYVLEACGGNRSLAARILGVDRKTLYRRLARQPEAGHG